MNSDDLAKILYGEGRTHVELQGVRDLLQEFGSERTDSAHRPHSPDMALRVATSLGLAHRLTTPSAQPEQSGWTHAELSACVAAYLDILRKELAGETFVKARVYRELVDGPLAARPVKAVERRFMNISHVMDELGLPYVTGLLPAANIGPTNKPIIQELIEASDTSFANVSEPTADPVELERRVELLRKKVVSKPTGQKAPSKTSSTSSTYKRDPEVIAYVLQEAAGTCEGCGEQGPFLKKGEPFLEVHHVKPLGKGGSDTAENAAGICPNCHRECHHSDDSASRTEAIYARTKRLVRE